MDHLFLGRAGLAGAPAGKRDFAQAEGEMDAAVEGRRRASDREFLPRGLLARAALWRAQGDFPGAYRDLDEALTIATRGSMRLHEANGRLELARLALAEGDRDAAPESLAAHRIVEQTGYKRREPEPVELEGELEEG